MLLEDLMKVRCEIGERDIEQTSYGDVEFTEKSLLKLDKTVH